MLFQACFSLTILVYFCYICIDHFGLEVVFRNKIVKGVDEITETFQKVEEDKRNRIIKAALQEFADNGYEQASTNRIVKAAEIGKGMLFYYFKNKETLFQYLAKYSCDIIMDDYFSQIEPNPDFLERLRKAAKVKMKAYTEYPEVFNFMGNILLSGEYELPADINEKIEKLKQTGYALMYNNINTSLFRRDVDVNKAFQLIRWSIEGYENDLIGRLQGKKFSSVQFDPYWDEFYEYLDILRKLYYQ